MKVQASGVGIRIASNIRYNIPERWIEGFADKYQGLIIKGKKYQAFAGTGSRHSARV